MRVLLTGAFGNIGSETLPHLLSQGHVVRCFDLDTKPNRRTARQFTSQIETLWGDLRRPEDVAAAVHNQEIVIHAAFVVDLRRCEQEPQWAREINVGGTKNILDAMKSSQQPSKIIFTSSVGVYGRTQHLPPPRTATDPVMPELVYHRHKVECEGLVRESGLDWCILRLTLAPSVKPKFDPIIFEGEPDHRLEFVHPSDAGLAIANAVSSAEAWGRVLLIGGGKANQMTNREFIRKLTEGIGGLPDEAFAPPGTDTVVTSDWFDTSESQRILNYQRRTIDDFIRDQKKAIGLVRMLAPIYAPLLRRMILRQSPYRKSGVRG